MTSRPPPLQLNNFPSFAAAPAIPPSPRKLRKFQSHQTLNSGSSFGFFAQQRSTPSQSGTVARIRDSAAPKEQPQNQNAPGESSTARPRPLRPRARSNSDAGSWTSKASDLAPSTIAATTTDARPRRPPRKTGSSGFAIKRSNLDNLLREGPADGKLLEALQELRLLVLSTRVDADGDGMVRLPSGPCVYGLILL
jgi:cell cycle arrest protein BUB2